MTRLRSLWLWLHRWVALSVGWVLALVGLAGAVLVVAQPLDRWGHPDLFRSGPSASANAVTAPLEPVRQRLVSELGADTTLTFRPPREPGDTLWVLVRGKWSGTVYLDPATGREQGRRAEDEGFVNVLFKLHSSLLLQDTGKAILACIALAYLTLLITGLVLWWPRRWPPSLRIQLSKGLGRGLFDLHRTLGAVMGLVIAVSVASGAYMAWRPLNDFVTFLAGAKSLKPPTLSNVVAAPDTAPELDALVALAQARFPNDAIGYIQVPGQANRPLRVRMRLADDPHPNGLTSVWLHPRTGAVLRVDRWNELDAGARAVSVVYPLHTGVLGGGWLEPVIFLSGLTLATLGFTGIWLWWKRRRLRRGRARKA
jgi:uncharacterized iron-regulated membrane protein